MDNNHQEFEVLVPDSVDKEDVVRVTNESREKTLEALRNNDKLHELKEGPLMDFMHEVRQLLVARNEKLGVKTPDYDLNVFIADKSYFPDTQGDMYIHGIADSNSNAIIIWDFEVSSLNDSSLEQDRELVLLNQAIVLSHELYHGLAPINYMVEKIDNLNNRVRHWRRGLFYFRGNSDEVTQQSLEEGPARIWEDEVRIKAREFFPKGAKLSDQCVDYLSRAKGLDSDKTIVSRYDRASNTIYTCGERYLDSKKLIKYLSSKVPNFEALVEKARIEGNLLDLIHAIDDKFGVGTYSELIDVEDDGASVFLQKLQDKDLGRGDVKV